MYFVFVSSLTQPAISTIFSGTNVKDFSNFEKKLLIFRPRQHYTVFKRKRYCFVPDTATVHTTTLKTITENGSFRKRSPEWNDLKTVLFENAVFLVWTAKTILSENDDVTTTVNHLAVNHSTVSIDEYFVTSLFTFCFISTHFQVEKETR